MEFTQEQQAHIDELIREKTNGLFTEEDLTRKVTSEVDRRIESGIQKGIETHKAKWESDFSDRAKLSAEELAQKELDLRLNELSTRELDIKKRSNTLDAKDMLSGASIPKSQYDKFIKLLVTDDVETTKSNVEDFINTFNETRVQIEADLKKQYANVVAPNGGDASKQVTKDEFSNMGYADMMKLKESDPEAYARLIK